MSRGYALPGQKFGRLTVTGIADPPLKRGQKMWHCVCECGAEKDVAGHNLVYGKTKSCGCWMNEARHLKAEDLTGQKFNRLTVLYRDTASSNRHIKWFCQCDCGTICSVAAGNLKNGHSKSSGCLSSETTAARNRANATHGDTNTRLYHSWCSMWTRCTDPKCASYCRYGGRGIRVCDEWQDYFKFREWALSIGYDYDANLTIDRIDPNRNYEPANCRFITQQQQNATKRNAIRVEYQGVTMCLKEWARKYHIPYLTLYNRYRIAGWDFERAITTPVKGRIVPAEERVAS